MAKLTTTRRNDLRPSTFGLPGARKYPMPTKSHARNALSRASQQFHAGNLSQSGLEQVRAKAHAVLKGD